MTDENSQLRTGGVDQRNYHLATKMRQEAAIMAAEERVAVLGSGGTKEEAAALQIEVYNNVMSNRSKIESEKPRLNAARRADIEALNPGPNSPAERLMTPDHFKRVADNNQNER
jgi:hypothetical protein